MYKIKCSFLIALLLFSYSIVSSQTVPKSTITKAAAQCKWVGTVKSSNFLFGEQTIVANVIFEFVASSNFWVEYKLTGGSATWTAGGMAGDCIVSGGPLQFDISPDAGDHGDLIIYSDGTYIGSGGFAKLLPTIELVTLTCPEDIITMVSAVYEFWIGKANLGIGYDTVVAGVMSGSVEERAGDFVWRSFQWDLHQEGVDTKLYVESDEYDDWLPTALNNEKEAGKEITFRSKLLEADGTTACATADSFKFELINVSNEPGIALNFPDENKAEKDWDLHFIQEFNAPDDVMSSDRLSLVTKGGSEAIVLIPSFDWGAYGKLKVTAFMHGGYVIYGFLKGHPGITEIPIPKRSGSSKIADKWKNNNGVDGLADDDDAENEPAGDGDVGDGFTLYEEYRGFYENGKHIFGDAKNKDLFIYKELDDFITGIQLFTALTKLKVHYKLNTSEFDTKKRMMNFNHTDAPHQTDQHGLWLKIIDNDTMNNFSSNLGPPKNVDSVNISPNSFYFSTFIEGSRREITDFLSSTVAHELGHAVRIKHHGTMDQKKNAYSHAFSYNGSTSAFELEITENNSTVIDPRWENDRPYTQLFLGKRYIGVWGGQHSGVEDCIMRYDCAFAYIPNTGGDIRYITSQERTGIILCEIKEGTGVNQNGRGPRPRYGPAVNGRCKFQICVNDKYH